VVDLGQNFASELHVARLDALQVHHRHDSANDRRELLQATFRELLGGQRHVRSTEIDRLGGDLANATTGTDGLVVHSIARGLLVGVSPLGIDRRGEGCACPGDVSRLGTEGEQDSERSGKSELGGKTHHDYLGLKD